MINPVGNAYFGLEDVSNKEEIKNATKIKIDYIILHNKSYRGGGSYGDYGGYDITLIHLEKPALFYITACLPKPNFPDNSRKGQLAGYGKYVRNHCQTDEYGPSKYHFCADPVSCETVKSHPQNSLCKKFFEDPVSNNLGDISDIILVDSTNNETYCYQDKSPKEGSVGWCHVNQDATIIQELSTTDSWGFCDKDCTKNDEPTAGVLRQIESVDIIEENLCNTYLEQVAQSVKVKPQILCIGKKEKIKMTVFDVDGTSFKKADSSKINHKSEMSPGKQK